MNLNEEQKKQVIQWLNEGAKVADIQNRLEKTFQLRMTYMEVRFLVDDLKVLPKDPAPPKAPEAPAKPASPAVSAPAAATAAGPSGAIPLELQPEPPLPGGVGGVKVTVDTVVRPGAMISGQVTFSDGKTAAWYLDQMGRLGMVASEKGYRPSAVDVEDFQMALQDELARKGF
ncbi:hypothetical protein LBMAG56_32580 [Verrucomicrobiota bacterium]|nr:hypothetical protein LBMAG56_32580 [Verrucomicrobiota bacterium]